jgi:hypothetical protein
MKNESRKVLCALLMTIGVDAPTPKVWQLLLKKFPTFTGRINAEDGQKGG